MHIRTRIGLTLICSLFLFGTSTLSGQTLLNFKTGQVSELVSSTLDQHFNAYSVIEADPLVLNQIINTSSFHEQMTIVIGEQKYAFTLAAHEIRSENYKLRVGEENGVIEYPRSPVMTFKGNTLSKNEPVRITSTPTFFTAMISGGKTDIYIEHVSKFVKTNSNNQFVIYYADQAVRQFNQQGCGVNERHYHSQQQSHSSHENEDELSEGRNRACRVVQVALANDFEMFQLHGSAAAVEAHDMAVINNVETNYDTEFADDLDFEVVEVFIAATNAQDPWTNSTNPENLLDDFTDWGPNGFDNTHDVASLWSARDFDGSTIGLAWVGAVCMPWRYNVLEDFSNNANFLRVLQAHELGHNFDANHDAEGSSTIMAPSVNNTNTWSNNSINRINNWIEDVNCLSLCQAAQPPVADFDADVVEGCVPLVVHYDDQSTNNPSSWSWTFEGGTPPTSTQQNPTVTYNTAGTWNVSLTVANTAGNDTYTVNNFITVEEGPSASFDFEIDEFTVDFTNESTNADTYLWNFGDGETSTQTNPLHVYDEDGTYTVTLTASSDCGSDTYTVTITILTPPEAFFDADIVEGCAPLTVQFYNESSSNSEDFEWSFPGGSPSTSTDFEPVVTYNNDGSFPVTLTVFNEAGQDVFTAVNFITVFPEPIAEFTQTINGLVVTFNSNGSVGDSYFWTFGDGETSSQTNPVHTYTVGGNYTVTLVVTNDCGSNSIVQNISLLGLPQATFGASVTSGCAPLVVQFTNTSGGNPTSFAWVFQGGNPATSNQANPLVTYNTPGAYDVQLTVTNAVGSDVVTLDNFINVAFDPEAAFTFSQSGNEVDFDNGSNHATTYLWQFGDGETSTSENPTHIYTHDGTYSVTLTAEGPCGTATVTHVVTITTAPIAGFNFDLSGSCSPVVVEYFNSSSSNTTSVLWQFPGGNPSSSTQENPVVTYSTPGLYDVSLIAFGPGGTDTLTWQNLVTVNASADADFIFTTEGLLIELTNLSDNATSYLWEFGDGTTSTQSNPSYTYGEYGTYTLRLIATNGCGPDTMEVVLELGDTPNSFFSYNNSNGCAPFEVQFIDLSQNGPTSWLWTFPGGNPGTSTEQNPTIMYNTPGNYFVSLQVMNGSGTDVLVLEDVIQVAGDPDATFEYEVQGSSVELNYPGTDFDNLLWSFGDGRTDNSQNPTVQYNTSGTYNISLIVNNACGADTVTVPVQVMVTAVDDPVAGADWKVFPNPFSDHLSIQGHTLYAGESTITIFDIHGKLLHSEVWSFGKGLQTKSLPTEILPEGMILILLQDENSRSVMKAIRTRS